MREDAIVVGYDGSAGADAAWAWGLSEAAVRGLPVHAVTVVDTREGKSHDPMFPPMADARSAVATVVRRARAKVPRVAVTGAVLSGPVAGTLCELSADADLLVVGSRGHGGFGGLLVGSVSLAVTTHAHCPVVVVPAGSPPAARRPVLLGVDDCLHGRLAALFAFDEAAARGVGVYAVRAVPAHAHRATGPLAPADAEWSGGEQELLDEVLSEGRSRYPEVDLVTRVVTGSPGEVLARESAQAQLLVVGSRGRGGFHGLLLGSVGSLAVHHATCPVAVVRERGIGARPLTPGSPGMAAPLSRVEP